MQPQPPNLLIPRESRFRACLENLRALRGSKYSRYWRRHHRRAYRKDIFLEPGQFPRSFFGSVVIHFVFVLFLVRLPLAGLFSDGYSEQETARKKEWEMHMLDLNDPGPLYLPSLPARVKPARPAKKGRAPAPEKSELTLLSNFSEPDNPDQTILQPDSPPDLKIPFELDIPNLVALGEVLAPPKEPKPEPEKEPKPEPKTSKEVVKKDPVPPKPKIEPKPAPKPFHLTQLSEVASLLKEKELPPLSTPPELLVNVQTTVDTASLTPFAPVAPPPPPIPAPEKESSGEGGEAGAPDSGLAGKSQEMKLLALSKNPVPPKAVVIVPAGNRQGNFSASTTGETDGAADGAPEEGKGNGDGGADGGGGIQIGKSTSGPEGPLSLNAKQNGSATKNGKSRVYRIPSPSGKRGKSLIVSTGPTGGGGLQVYGVLRGGRIFTTYLLMPGKDWILQYCVQSSPKKNGARGTRNVTIRLGRTLVAPYPFEKFDFERPPLPPEKARRMIVLHGVILEDGSVAELKVLQSLDESADEAALTAFRRWRFQAAQHGVTSVAVEILVGIPAATPPRRSF